MKIRLLSASVAFASAALVLFAIAAPVVAAVTLNGAGATFPEPLYAAWMMKYNELKGIKVNYQGIGSSGGISQIKAKTVDFGGTDAPLKPAELDEAGLVQFPMVIGGVVPVVHVEGVGPGELRLTADVLAGMFSGAIGTWDDEAIKKLNPTLTLPNEPITVVHRAEGSGTTWIFTNYLDKVSQTWHEKIGTDKTVAWPTGVGAKGNPGVAAYVQRVNGSIGYVEYAYAAQNKMAYATLANRAGTFVAPTMESFQAAAANADWKNAKGYYLVLTDQPGDASWPIVGATFILMQKNQEDAARAKALLDFFDWCYTFGGAQAKSMDYVPLPPSVVEMVRASWRSDVTAGGKPVWK